MYKTPQNLAEITGIVYGGANGELKLQYVVTKLLDIIDDLHKHSKIDSKETIKLIEDFAKKASQDDTILDEAIKDELRAILASLEGYKSSNEELKKEVEALKFRKPEQITNIIQGEKGEKGDKGEDGAPGIDGQNGIDGVDGKDATLADIPTQELADKLNEEEEIIEIKTIKNLKKELNKLVKSIGGGVIVTNVEGPSASSKSWVEYCTSSTADPTLEATIGAGEVYKYIYTASTLYRLVPTVYVYSQDAFYSSFDGSNLSGLVINRTS